MGRRSFAKIQKNLDLSSALKLTEDLPESWDPVSLFGRTAPIEFEIGSGKGMFIRKAAAKDPSRDFIGIEIAYRYAMISAAGIVKDGLTNAVMICADAAKILAERVPDAGLAAVHVYFPDPWWKKSHRKRRILRTDVIKLIEQKLVPGGKLHFWTDVEEYYLSTLDLIARETSLQGPIAVPDPETDEEKQHLIQTPNFYGEQGDQNPPAPRTAETDDSLDFHTHFERRTRLNHLPVWRSYFVKPE